jgi:hypothetical protein
MTTGCHLRVTDRDGASGFLANTLFILLILYLLKVRTADMQSYRRFLGEQLADIPNVRETHTYVVMQEVKSELAIPLEHSEVDCSASAGRVAGGVASLRVTKAVGMFLKRLLFGDAANGYR